MNSFSRSRLIQSVVGINALNSLHSELYDYLFKRDAEIQVLKRYGNYNENTKQYLFQWFLNQPLHHDVVFHLNAGSSVLDKPLRRLSLREERKLNSLKDFFTYFVMAIVLPRTGLVVSAVDFARNILMDFDIENEAVIDVLERCQVGRSARLFMMVYPLRYVGFKP